MRYLRSAFARTELDRRSPDPYLEKKSVETGMQRQRILAAIIALGTLLVTPIAWGCEGTDMKSCSMSDCPMMEEQPAEDCHESPASSEHDSSGCEAATEVWIACCDAPIDQEPVKVDSASNWDHSTTPLIVLAERIEVQLPSRPPDLISEAISAQQHELGRFTLLSSFLL